LAPPPRRPPWVAIILAVGLIAIVLCAGLAFVGLPLANSYIYPGSYVYEGQVSAGLIQWAEHDGQLSGTFQITYVDTSGSQARLQVTAVDFTGVRDGSSVTITFHGLFGVTSSLHGTLGFRTLELQVPQKDGTVATGSFAAGDIQDYNAAVQDVKRAHPEASP
jgi:hypothetical protein